MNMHECAVIEVMATHPAAAPADVALSEVPPGRGLVPWVRSLREAALGEELFDLLPE